MAVNLINSEGIHVNQTGSDISLEVQAGALKNENAIVGTIKSKNIAREISYKSPTSKYGGVVSATYSLEVGKTYTISFDTTNTNLDIYRQTPENIGFTSLTPYSVTCDGTRKSFTGIASATATYSNITIISRLSDTSATPIEISNLMIEENPTPTAYTPYQNLDGYDNYSTNEERVGTWIDGKPIYRKVINAGTVSASNTNIGSISNIDTLVSIKGTAYSSQFTQRYGIPNVHSDISSFYINLLMAGDNVVIRFGSGTTSLEKVVAIIDYTKTT